MPASSIPGLIVSHRFSDAPECYDSALKRFKGQAGYGAREDLRVTVGTPIFETVNGQRCVRMDNTCHGVFPSPIPWKGSVVMVLQPVYVSGATLTRYPALFGDAATPSSNGSISVVHASGARRVGVQSASAQLQGVLARNDNNVVAVAFAHDQSTRMQYRSADGVTVSTATATASAVNGNAVALGSAQYGVRWGNLSGTAGDVTPINDVFCRVMRWDFYSENILVGDNLALTAARLAELKAEFGAS